MELVAVSATAGAVIMVSIVVVTVYIRWSNKKARKGKGTINGETSRDEEKKINVDDNNNTKRGDDI